MEEERVNNPADKLLPELWMEIFSKLPAKTLLKSRSVSKFWRSLIDNPGFISMHITHFKNNSSKHFVLSYETRNTMWILNELELNIRVRTMGKFRKREEILETIFLSSEYHIDYKGYVDGLILFGQLIGDKYDLFLFNPSIRKRMLLPQIPFCPGGRADTVIGFDPVINDYKVVMIFFPFVLSELEGPASILVYELGTGCWRVNVGVEVPIMWYFGDKVLARGVMHWISFSLDERPLRTNYTHIVSFDFGSETFSYTELPGDRWDDKDKFTWPFLLGDQFAVLDVARASACIWVMKNCGGSRMEAWSKWYHTTDSDTYKFFLEHKAVKNLIYIESIHKFLLEVDGVVKSYDLESHKMKNLEVTDCRYVMDPYVESLLLCKGLNDQFSTKIMEYGGFG